MDSLLREVQVSTTATIYKICSRSEWDAAVEAGRFDGAPVDIADGYIHFSTAGQVAETARRHFAGQTDLVLVAVDVGALCADLKWEPSRGGDLFPHLYGPLPASAAKSVVALPVGDDGMHQFPSLEA